MDDLNHHILKRKTGNHVYRRRFRDCITGRKIHIRDSLLTRDMRVARRRRDILHNPHTNLCSEKDYAIRKKRMAEIELYDATGVTLVESPYSDTAGRRACPPRDEVLQAYLEAKQRNGGSASGINTAKTHIAAFYRFISHDGLYATQEEAEAFSKKLSTCKVRTWSKPGSFMIEAKDPSDRVLEKTRVNVISDLKAFFKYCTKQKHYLTENPFEWHKAQKVNPTKIRPRLSPEEVTQIRSSIALRGMDQTEWTLAVKLASRIGARRAELLLLRAEDFHFESKVPYIEIVTLKQGGDRTKAPKRLVPIPTVLIQQFRSLAEERKSGPIFPSLSTKSEMAKNDPGTHFGRLICKQIQKINADADFHCLRVYCISELGDRDVPGPLISAIVGHKGIATAGGMSATTLIYMRQNLARMLTAIDAIP